MSTETPEEVKRRRARERSAKYRDRLRREEPDKLKAMYRKQNLKHCYGLSPDEVAAMLLAQGSKCRVCSADLLQENGRRNCTRGHVVDHCHTTKKVRGILCHRCNQGLGLFRDNPDYLANAINYLKEYSL